MQNCFLTRRHLPEGHSQSETHSDLLPEYLVIRMVGAMTMINMIENTMMLISPVVLIKSNSQLVVFSAEILFECFSISRDSY